MIEIRTWQGDEQKCLKTQMGVSTPDLAGTLGWMIAARVACVPSVSKSHLLLYPSIASDPTSSPFAFPPPINAEDGAAWVTRG